MSRRQSILDDARLPLYGKRELDRLVEEKIRAISARLRTVLLQNGELEEVKEARLLRYESCGTNFSVETGHDPLFTPIVITTDACRAARNWDCGVEWGPTKKTAAAPSWFNDLDSMRRECQAVVGALDLLYRRLKSERS